MENRNSGILSKNSYKREGTKQPDANGTATLVCPHCNETTPWVIAGWLRNSAKGRFSSLLFKTKAQAEREKADYLAKKHGDTVNPDTTPAIDAHCDEEIPF